MSLPLLSPAETAIFDEDVISEMEEHADDVAPCEAEGCSEGVTTLTLLRCCKHGWRTCDLHHAEARGNAVVFLAKCFLQGASPHCLACRHVYPLGAKFDEVYRVVWL